MFLVLGYYKLGPVWRPYNAMFVSLEATFGSQAHECDPGFIFL